MASVLRGLIQFFDLPMSRNQPGPAVQVPIRLGAHELSLSICYEITDAELVRRTAQNPALLITVSNDTWFGASIGPEQHLQIAATRAAELARSVVRVTNNGVTALISHEGDVLARLPKNEPGVLVRSVPLYTGQTPYSRFGQLPLIVLLFGLMVSALIRNRL
jgi:apolipoprotein N-acyltransferase